MELVLVRHAIACQRDSERWPNDGRRPLSPRGVLRARKAAAGLKRLIARPRRVLTSPLLRTRQTAEVLAERAGWPAAIPCAELAPEEPAQALLAILHHEQDELVALVGHQPGLSELIALALPGSSRPEAFELKRFGVALLSFEAAPAAGSGTLQWLLPPRLLRAVR